MTAAASSSTSPIRLINAALDDHDGEITLRGILDPASLAALKVADYQREILPGAKAKDLAAVLESGSSVPDITLGMRGGGFTEHRGGVFTLDDRVYIIDGLQRTTAAMAVLKAGTQPRLGAIVYFNTTEASERLLFRQLNTLRTKLSPNVLLYNERHANPQIRLLFDLCQDSTFALYQRVSWKQLMNRAHLVNAVMLVGAAAELHAHFGMSTKTYQILKVADAFSKLKIPRNALRDNVKAFWQLVDTCWNVREITYKQFAPHLKRNFISSLCAVLTRHEDFWDDSVLKVPATLRKKLATFPLSDPSVSQLCSAGGSATMILYPMIVEHLNKGKKTQYLREVNALRLRPGPKRGSTVQALVDQDEEEEEEEGEE